MSSSWLPWFSSAETAETPNASNPLVALASYEPQGIIHISENQLGSTGGQGELNETYWDAPYKHDYQKTVKWVQTMTVVDKELQGDNITYKINIVHRHADCIDGILHFYHRGELISPRKVEIRYEDTLINTLNREVKNMFPKGKLYSGSRWLPTGGKIKLVAKFDNDVCPDCYVLIYAFDSEVRRTYYNKVMPKPITLLQFRSHTNLPVTIDNYGATISNIGLEHYTTMLKITPENSSASEILTNFNIFSLHMNNSIYLELPKGMLEHYAENIFNEKGKDSRIGTINTEEGLLVPFVGKPFNPASAQAINLSRIDVKIVLSGKFTDNNATFSVTNAHSNMYMPERAKLAYDW